MTDVVITIGSDPGKYTTEKTMWVDATTGSILKQTEHQIRKMAATGQTVLDLDFGFTPETVANNVADAKDNGSRLTLLTQTVPLVGIIGGVLLLVVGFLLFPRDVPERPVGERRRVGTSA